MSKHERRRANGQALLAAMNGLEDGLVELMPQEEIRKAGMQGRGRMKRMAGGRFKWAAVTACLLCLIGGSAVFAASRLGWRIGDSVDPHNPDAGYYWVDYKTDLVSADAFGEQVLAVVDDFKEEARKEADSGSLDPNRAPRGWVKEFGTVAEMLDFVGFEGLMDTALPDWNVWEGTTSLGVYGDLEGKLINVGMLSSYKTLDGKIMVQTGADIFTEDFCYNSSIGRPFDKERQNMQGKEYVTERGKTGLIMAPEYDGGCSHRMEGYMVEGEILYSIWLYYGNSGDLEEKGLAEDALMKVMREWMEQF